MREKNPLKSLRELIGSTQDEMADALGCPRERISQVENNHTRLSHDHITRICELYPVELARLELTALDFNRGRAA